MHTTWNAFLLSKQKRHFPRKKLKIWRREISFCSATEVHHYWNVVRQENQVGTVQTLNIYVKVFIEDHFTIIIQLLSDLRCKRENLLKIRSISHAKVGIYIYFWDKKRCKYMLQCVSFVNCKLCGDDNSICTIQRHLGVTEYATSMS